METIQNLELSAELQELYLENKEWQSQIDFLKDELRFFTKLFGSEKCKPENHSEAEILLISDSLTQLQTQIDQLQALTSKHQHLIETIIKNKAAQINLELIEQNAVIAKEIKHLLRADRALKKELFKFIENKDI